MHYSKGGVDAFKRKRTLEIDVEVLEDNVASEEHLQEIMQESKSS